MLWVLVGALLVAGAAGAAASRLAVLLRRERGRYTRAIEERGWLLERERESAAQQAVDLERSRIARELHDIVSHNVSMMLIQAGAARQVLAAAPAQSATAEEPAASGVAEDALLAVESAGRATMTELRHLLGVLAPAADGRDQPGAGADPALAPQPTLSRLSALVDKIAFAGLPVDARISGEPRPLPGGIDSTAYRIVQEALTNALKHGGRDAALTIRYDDRYLRIEILTAGHGSLDEVGTEPAPRGGERIGTGRGLTGLKERVAVYGGDLDARRRLGGGFRVRAKIPLDEP
ncbi:histidine kinase [Catenulispora acidiphila DSM 44928]|uniref:histidine kinase n=1 Tax=Catenulispora acidiphila (strain DSM 44928 / JCM 14897 / NBRC 102108 / NRRL B-24433 / ID139908) TaxID=479433 RepID=C7QE47_CATAD|nr:histidine kinase [Catenulispora acidiphila]ACU76635.1 histidine kinase [Catenulispora acidiphila DSM 44928]